MALEFDVDVCAPPGGIAWIPARRYYTQADDGLAQSWHGRVWMNPPYSEPRPWVERFIQHANGVALVPCSNGRWFHDLWCAADAITPPTDNALKFAGPSGQVLPLGIPIRTVLAAFGAECVEAIARIGVVRRIA